MSQDPHDYRDRIYARYRATMFPEDSLVLDERSQHTTYRKLYGRFLPTDKDARILDLGCGESSFLRFLQTAGYRHLYGVDRSEEQVARARLLSPQAAIQRADLFEYLRGRKAEFDLLFCQDVLEHLTKPEVCEGVSLILEALKPGGHLLAATLNAQCPFSSRIFFSDFTHETGFTPRSVRQLLSAVGFEPIEIFSRPPVAYSVMSLGRTLLWASLEPWCRLMLTTMDGRGTATIDRHDIVTAGMIVRAAKP